ncbi:MAG: PleD family two-component system response regulator [Alphaproteobacteria bacterium]
MSARVLVVDDVPANVKLLEAKLTAEYFDVITAPDGPSALAAAESELPDIILLDVMMPEMDGFEVCRRLRENPRTAHIPVVMVTALSEVSDRVQGLEAGADDFLTKPVNNMALFARIKSLVRLKMTMDEWRRREETCDRFGVLSDGRLPAREDASEARVLVVETGESRGDWIAKALAQDGDELTTAPGAEAGIELARDGAFDLIITDATASGEADGDPLRLCSSLRSMEECRSVPILIMVEANEVERLAKGLDLGVNDYIVKPMDPHELLARVRTQVRGKRYQDRLRANFERSLSMALTDNLTGLYNRRYMDVHLGTMMQRMVEEGRPLGLLMIDIDFFKSVNDRYGHGVGDEVLFQMAKRICGCVRGFDMVARHGGEEFVVVLPGAPPEVIHGVAERLRHAIAEEPFPVSDAVGKIEVSVSVGAAMVEGPGDAPKSLLKRADMAMYQAKRQGRNRVIADFDYDEDVTSESATPQKLSAVS